MGKDIFSEVAAPGIRVYLFAVAFAGFVPLFGYALWSWIGHVEHERTQRAGDTAIRAEAVRLHVDHALGYLKSQLEYLAYNWNGEASVADNDRRLHRRMKTLPDYVRYIARLDSGGRMINSTATPASERSRLDFSDRDHFKSAMRVPGPFVGEPVASRTTGEQVVVLAQAIAAGGAPAPGVVVIGIDLRRFGRAVLGHRLIGAGDVRVVSASGALLLDSNQTSDAPGRRFEIPAYQKILALDSGLEAGIARLPGGQGLMARSALANAPWVVVASLGDATALQVAHRELRGELLIGAATLLASLLLAVWLARRIGDSIAGLETATRQLASSEAVHQVRESGPRELVELARRFNRMAAELFAERRALRESEERFRNLVKLSSDWYWEQDAQLRFTYMSGDLQQVTGITTEEHIGRTDWDLPALNLSAADWSRHRAQLDARAPFHDFEIRRPGVDGRPHWVSLSGEPVFDAAGEFRGYRGVGKDITARKLAEDALRANEERFRQLTGMSADFYWELDANFRLTWLAGKFFDESGVAQQELVGQQRWALNNLEPVEVPVEQHRRTLEARLPYRNVLFRRVQPDGETIYALITGQPVFSADGAFLGYRGVGLDVTETRRLETEQQRLRAERNLLFERLDLMLKRMPVACLIEDAEFKVVGVNPAFERVFGYTQAETVGRHPFELFVPPERHVVVSELFERLRQGQIPDVIDGISITKQGEHRVVQWLNTPLHREDGVFLGVISMATDITDRVAAEEALRESEARIRNINAELEARVARRTADLQNAIEELESLSYTIAHDLRSPLRAIDGFSRFLEDELGDGLSAEARGHLARIRGNTQTMAQLIDGLLEFAKLGRLDVERGPVDLDALVRGVVENLAPSFPRAQIRLDALPVVQGDRALLRQVFDNLIGNALKFSTGNDAPRIEVRAESKPGEVVVSVADNGVGFDMRYARKLFGVFQRLHTLREFEGTGIGLATVQRIVGRHGGRVWGEGMPGKGACFHVALPQTYAIVMKEKKKTDGNGPRQRVTILPTSDVHNG